MSEIDRYFLPKARLLLPMLRKRQRKTLRIDPGMSEAEVVQKLDKPLRTLRVGDQTVFKYPDLTITLGGG